MEGEGLVGGCKGVDGLMLWFVLHRWSEFVPAGRGHVFAEKSEYDADAGACEFVRRLGGGLEERRKA